MMEAGVLHYVGRELVEGGLLQNDSWVADAVWRTERMFATKGLKVAAGILASLHPRAIDFIEQCPPLVVAAVYAAAKGEKSRNPMAVKRIRMRMASHFYSIFREEPRLRDLVRMHGLTNQHRALKAWGLREDYWPVLVALSSLPPSTLAQIVPEKTMEQANWLNRLLEWRRGMARAANNPDLHFAWAAVSLSQIKSLAPFVWPSDVADFVARSGVDLNDRWTWERAGKESQDWHAALRRLEEDKRHHARFGLEWSEPCDYGALPVDLVIDKVQFVALRSGADLAEEGGAMHHCVRSYIDDVMVGRCRIYGLRVDDRRVATMEMVLSAKSRWSINQLKGPYNAQPANYVHAAASAFLRQINGAPA